MESPLEALKFAITVLILGGIVFAFVTFVGVITDSDVVGQGTETDTINW